MKTMTCKQLHGPCDAPIQGKTSEEMMNNSKRHGMEMAAKGDKDHINVMKAMKEKMEKEMNNPEAMKQWMEKFQSDFDAVPEDE